MENQQQTPSMWDVITTLDKTERAKLQAARNAAQQQQQPTMPQPMLKEALIRR